MDCQPPTVEWVDDPEDWLLPVVAALDDALLCCVPPSEPNGTGGLTRRHVLRISVETRDAPTSSGGRADMVASYRQNPLGKSYEWIRGHKFHLIAKKSVLRFSTRPLLHTRIGHWLHIKGWTWPVAFLFFLPVCALTGLQPGARIVNVPNPGGPPDDAVTLAIEVPSLVTTSVAAAFMVLTFVIVFQRTSRDLFIGAMCSFECLCITCGLVVSRSAWAYEQLALLNMAGEFTLGDLASFLVFVFLISVPAGLALNAFDSYFLSQRLRSLVLTVNLAHAVYLYFKFARLTQWSDIQVCQWFYCTSPKHVCVSAYGNYVVFTAKLWLAYIRGEDFAIVRTAFKRPGPATHYHLDGRCLIGCCCRRREARAKGKDGEAPQNSNVRWPGSPEQAVRVGDTSSNTTVSTSI